jgi:hypothetical protein
MQKRPSLLTLCAGLWLTLFVGQELAAAKPLWELRAERKAKKDRKKAPPPPEAPRQTSELDRVMGQDARALMQMFGQPAQDVREASARKLQFATNDCILDAYLYAPMDGKDPVVTYITTRVSDGRDAERNSCITALRIKR